MGRLNPTNCNLFGDSCLPLGDLCLAIKGGHSDIEGVAHSTTVLVIGLQPKEKFCATTDFSQ